MLNIFYSPLNYLSCDYLITQLKNRDKTQKHIIITPDRASLNYEKKLFDLIGESSFFDVTTTTLSRFCAQVVSASGNNGKVLSSQGGTALVKKILLENKSEFKSFKKVANMQGFAKDLFDTICMFKSCNIYPDSIVIETSNSALNSKLQDIKLIYSKYEDYLKNDFTDSFNRLNLCAKLIGSDYANHNFYFLGFNDFTKQGYNIVKQLLKFSHSVNVATTFAKSTKIKNNSAIYLNNLYYNLIDLSKLSGIDYQCIEVKSELQDVEKHLCNNAFSYKYQKYEAMQKFYNVCKYENMNEEIKNVVSEIKYRVITQGCRYKDFAIIIPSLSTYGVTIKKILNDYSVAYFVDESESLKNEILPRYINNVLNLLTGVTKFDVYSILKSQFCDIDKEKIFEYEDYVNKYGIIGEKLLNNEKFVEIQKVLLPYFSFIQSLKCKTTVKEYVIALQKLFDEIALYDKLQDLSQKLYLEDLLEYRKLEQSYNKIGKIHIELIELLGDYVCDSKTFIELYNSYISNISITLPPILADNVFIGENGISYFDKYKYVYMLGVNEGNVPCYSLDCGIITDDEISVLPDNVKLNPTINTINKQNKFKVFENLFCASQEMNLSFYTKSSSNDNMYPSSFLVDMIKMFNVDVVDGSLKNGVVLKSMYGIDRCALEQNNFNYKTAVENFISYLKYYELYKTDKNYIDLLNTLFITINNKEYLNNYNYENIIENVKEKIFLNTSHISASQIERYNDCAYAHFMNYGLRLQEVEGDEVRSIDVGNIIHEFLKDNIIFKDVDCDIEKIVEDKINQILSNDVYEYLIKNPFNNFVIKSLKNECKRICQAIIYQQSKSTFKTELCEAPFKCDIPNLVVNKKQISLVGKIDRVDINNNNFRVIDYKTGNSGFDDYTNIVSGRKIQLIVYLYALCDKKLLNPVGAFYLPISNDYVNNDSLELYSLKGVIEKSLGNLLSFDSELSSSSYASNIINISTNKDGKINEKNNYYQNLCLDKNQFTKLIDYVVDLVKETTAKIASGDITPNPYPLSYAGKPQCEYCLYKGVCNFNQLYGNNYKEVKIVKNVNELLGMEVKDE